jgi:hypothetical protein
VPASQDRAWNSRSGWLSEVWRSPGATPGATGRCPPRIRRVRSKVPQTLNVRHGVFVVENLDTKELAADGISEFAFILTHPKLRGAAGAWTSPIAMV